MTSVLVARLIYFCVYTSHILSGARVSCLITLEWVHSDWDEFLWKKEKEMMAQLGIEPRLPTLCLKPAGPYIVGVIPLAHCAFLSDCLVCVKHIE